MNPQKAQWAAFVATGLSVVAIPLVLASYGDRSGLLACDACPDGLLAVQWTRAVSGVLIGLASMAIAAALLRWAPRGRAFGAGWPFVLLAGVLLGSGLAQWFEVLVMWQPGWGMGESASYLSTVTTGLTAVALFHTLPRLWKPSSGSPRADGALHPLPAGACLAAPQSPGQVEGCVHLAQCAHERTRHLVEASATALAQAERASQMKDTFLAMVSHELRTPLQSTLYWAELLRREGASPALLAQASQHVIHNVKVQSRLIADLLDMSRLLTGQLRMEFQAVDAVAAVRSAVDMVQAEAAVRGITVNFEAPEQDIQLVTDPCRLEQVAWNLVSNAVHASQDGTQVEVSLAAHGQRVQLVVQDHGVGIAPHDLPHIFDSFCQGEARAVRHGGLGLGLTISRNIVQQFGGHIEARSDGLGLGSCFYVDLPLQPPPPAAS